MRTAEKKVTQNMNKAQLLCSSVRSHIKKVKRAYLCCITFLVTELERLFLSKKKKIIQIIFFCGASASFSALCEAYQFLEGGERGRKKGLFVCFFGVQ